MKPNNRDLRDFIVDSFNEAELQTFCFEYFREVRLLWSDQMPFGTKIMELIEYCERHEKGENLLVALQKERPQKYATAFGRITEPVRVPTPYQPGVRQPKKVFMSHASADYALAKKIATDVVAMGYEVFITPDSIDPGEKWVAAINRGLEECSLFLVLLTPRAVASGWVYDEVNAAIKLDNEKLAKLYFLDAEPCTTPILWGQRQWISFRDATYETNWGRLKAALAGNAVTIPSSPPGPQPTPAKDYYIHSKTGLEFVRIPEGEFIYGEGKTEEKRYLPEYWMCKTPVTQQVYQRFIDANPKYKVPFVEEDWAKAYNWDRDKRRFPAEKADHPVVLVSWHDAIAFCKWAGLELPTEVEWEKAARGVDGRRYPWEDGPPTAKLINFNENVGGTTPVGAYSPRGNSPYGCADMSGNVWEWCLNKYHKPEDTGIDQSNDGRVVRGGSWADLQDYARAACRYFNGPNLRFNYIGFRPLLRRAPSPGH